MPLSYSIKTQGHDIQKSMRNLKNFQRRMAKPMERAVNWIIDDISEYKPKAKGAFTRYATTKQKRAYWARVRKGIIQHGPNGYVRTVNTSRSWTSKIQRHSGGVRGVIGNRQPHAIYVHSAKYQQKFHQKTGFLTDEKAFQKNRARIDREFQRELRKAAEG